MSRIGGCWIWMNVKIRCYQHSSTTSFSSFHISHFFIIFFRFYGAAAAFELVKFDSKQFVSNNIISHTTLSILIHVITFTLSYAILWVWWCRFRNREVFFHQHIASFIHIVLHVISRHISYFFFSFLNMYIVLLLLRSTPFCIVWRQTLNNMK